MKIIFTLNYFLPHRIAGTEIYCLQLAKYLKVKGNDITVLIPNYGKETDNSYNHEGIKVIQFAEPTIVDRDLIMRRKQPLGISAFTRILKEEKPDLIHFHNVGGSNGVGIHHVRAAAALSLKILFTFHIAGYTCSTGTLHFHNEIRCDGYIDPLRCTTCIYSSKNIKGTRQKTLAGLAAIFYRLGYNSRQWDTSLGTALGFPFMIKEMKEDLVELTRLGAGIIVLTDWYKRVLELNGVPADKLYKITQGLAGNSTSIAHLIDDGQKTFKLIYIGRITESKGLHLLTEAVKKIDGSLICLSIYGAPAEEKYLEELKAATVLNKNIFWKGSMEPKDVIAEISRHDCLCVPSVICEMSPLVIQEAFAANIPVLASNVYGNAEQIEDGKNGWLFKFNDSNDLSEKISSLVQNPSLLSEAKKNIGQVKSFETVGEEHQLLYTQILQQVN